MSFSPAYGREAQFEQHRQVSPRDASNGNFTFLNSGDLDLMGVSASGVAAISATGKHHRTTCRPPLHANPPTSIPFIHAVHGGTGVTLTAGGAIGSSAAPLAVAAPALDASAAYGIAIDLKRVRPDACRRQQR